VYSWRSWVSLAAAAGELEGSRLLSSSGPEDVSLTPAPGPKSAAKQLSAPAEGEAHRAAAKGARPRAAFGLEVGRRAGRRLAGGLEECSNGWEGCCWDC
jgi:hypothetical protein